MSTNEASRLDRTALIFGASGITGWAIVREAVQYPTPETFRRIIGLTNRPFDRNTSLLPDDNRIELVAGLDLSAGPEAVTAKLREVPGIEEVTDVFFAAYVQPPGTSDVEGWEQLKLANVDILETAVAAVESVSPNMRYWSLQTGGKAYGFAHAREIGPPAGPCHESDARIPQPYADMMFYYAQHDALVRLSSGKKWRFAEIRPNDVVGFVPTGSNAMNIAQSLGIFLAFYAWQKRKAAKSASEPITVQFPGPVASFKALNTETSQKTLARGHLFASSHDAANGDIINVADTASTSWAQKWTALCAYFGLVGLAPDEGAEHLRAVEFMQAHQAQWADFERENGLKPGLIGGSGWEFMQIILELVVFDRVYDLSKANSAGFKEKEDIVQMYLEVFDLMKATKMLPQK
ncbi:hypothetical protein NA57DRAFT_79153 [Rhizodiscina lignyota]|uniref:PRISE-like Rossmann-fold domain-containing protein n=1 Tax=Rhizodiscina lignyota TaxID=1504668 RepID=A0A9P4M288_9PEZI|nr:hypothetical protein NA57DRAFT_79153 [Rhizodiscina lignyota]